MPTNVRRVENFSAAPSCSQRRAEQNRRQTEPNKRRTLRRLPEVREPSVPDGTLAFYTGSKSPVCSLCFSISVR